MYLVECNHYWVAVRYVGCDGISYKNVIAICNRKGCNKKEEWNIEQWNALKLTGRVLDKTVVV